MSKDDYTLKVRLHVALQAPTGRYVVQGPAGRRTVAADELDTLGQDEDVSGEDSPVVGFATSAAFPFVPGEIRTRAREFRAASRELGREPDTVIQVLGPDDEVLTTVDLLADADPA